MLYYFDVNIRASTSGFPGFKPHYLLCPLNTDKNSEMLFFMTFYSKIVENEIWYKPFFSSTHVPVDFFV